ncbi:MAG: phosphoadenylyl-sulfate reductase [Spirochaetota bacterium]
MQREPRKRSDLARLDQASEGLDTGDLLAFLCDRIAPGTVKLASSLGAEDQVLTHIIAERALPITVLTLDTGRLFPESYDLMARTRAMGVSFEVVFPDGPAVEEMVRAHGVNLFRDSVELRKRCCGIRKVDPLNRALAGCSAWVTGMRREQAVTRGEISRLEWDADREMLKVNPLADWSEDEVWQYVREHDVPYHPLHDEGFPSIGCAPCTRAVKPGEDPRAGRWWWESPEHKECGLHVRAATAQSYVNVKHLDS